MMIGDEISSHHLKQEIDDEQPCEEFLTLEQLHDLVQLLNVSDVSELQVKDHAKNARLVLRKPQHQQATLLSLEPMSSQSSELKEDASVHSHSTISAHLVGIFHIQGKGKNEAFVTEHDHVTAGQLVGMIQSLGTTNEVEAPAAGRILEILVQDGQLVEYGQPLMTFERD